MQRVRPEAPGGYSDARRQRSLPVLRYPPGAHVLGLRPAAHRCRDHRCRPGLRVVLPGSAAAMRALRADPQDRQAGHGVQPDLCYSCYQGASAVCSACGETRPCQRISSGSPICRRCRARPARPCFRCGRARPVQAEWPAGPVCVGCYEHVRRHPAECAGCGVIRPLIGSDKQGRPLCGPCAGAPGLDYTCRECGRGGEIHSGRAVSAASWANAPGSCSPAPAGTFPPSCIPCSRRSPRSPTRPPW